MKIEVLKEDIQNGIACHCNMCPIALAIQQAIPEAINVYVSATYAQYQINNVVFEARLPEAAQVFIEEFDDIENVGLHNMRPFVFDINPKKWEV